jgi:hypothetical protein
VDDLVADVAAVVRAERDERLTAAAQLDAVGRGAAADELRAAAAVLAAYL